MAKSRKKSKGKQAVRRGGIPAWALVLVGIIVGAVIVAGVIYTHRMPMSRTEQVAQPQAVPNAGKEIKPVDNTDTASSQYDFYSILPEKKITIPDATTPAETTSEPPKAVTRDDHGKVEADGALLQMGSFSHASDANAVKAKIAIQTGLRARVESAQVNGKTWYRVRLGPFQSADKLKQAQQTLKSAGFNSQVTH